MLRAAWSARASLVANTRTEALSSWFVYKSTGFEKFGMECPGWKFSNPTSMRSEGEVCFAVFELLCTCPSSCTFGVASEGFLQSMQLTGAHCARSASS